MMTFDEIAKRLGVSTRSVYKSYTNGMRKIAANPAKFDMLMCFYEERNEMRREDANYQCGLLPSWEGRALAGIFTTQESSDGGHR